MQLKLRSAFAAVVAFVALVALATPAGALAGGGCSACQVYSPDVPSAGGGQSSGPTGTSVPLSTGASHVLAHSGRDKSLLKPLLTDPGLGARRDLESVNSGTAGSPSALGAVFDLGPGPVALFAILVATALTIAVRGGLRGWRHLRS